MHPSSETGTAAARGGSGQELFPQWMTGGKNGKVALLEELQAGVTPLG